MPHTGIVLLLLILAFFASTPAMPTRERVGQLLASSQYEILSNELKSAAREKSSEFGDNNYDYLLGRIEEKRGDYASAALYYHTAAARDPDLAPYALKHLSQIMRFSGNLAFERLFLNEIVFSEKGKILRGPALLRQTENNFESGDNLAAINAIKTGVPGVTGETSIETDRDLIILLGYAYLRNNNQQEARAVFEGIIDSSTDPDRPDDFSLEAVKGLDALDTGDSKTDIETALLTAAEHKRRAAIYQFNRNFERARFHYSALLKKGEDAEISFAMYQIARGYDQERNYEESLSWYQKILDRFPEIDLAASALYGTAGAYANLDDNPKAVAAYLKYVNENPEAANLERAYLNIVDAYRDAGDNSSALQWTSKIRVKFSGQMGEAVALFCEARIHISDERWTHALEALKQIAMMNDLGGFRIAGGTNRIEVDFLTAFVFEKLRRYEEAADRYLKIQDGRASYYGWRATERLRKLLLSPESKVVVNKKITDLEKQNTKINSSESRNKFQSLVRLGNVASLKMIRSEYRAVPAYSDIPEFGLRNLPPGNGVGGKLLKLGLYDEAAPEIELSLRRSSGIEGDALSDFDDGTAYTLAGYYSKGGYPDRAIRFIEPKWKKVPKDFQTELIPVDQAALLYPAPFRDELLKHSKAEKIDPRLLLAIMRQESRFQADVKSSAAARGLMQFISGTSRKIADELKIEEFSNDELYDPDTAIKFGSRLVANLFRDFPDRPQAVLASYNAGEDRVERWVKRSKTDDPDRYVAEIVFSQTKDYVYSVMANYRMYLNLYDENLVLKEKPTRN